MGAITSMSKMLQRDQQALRRAWRRFPGAAAGAE
jgi:hypothetical protein